MNHITIRTNTFFIVFLLFFSSCVNSKPNKGAVLTVAEKELRDTVSYEKIGNVEKDILLIKKEVNLNGAVCLLPKGVTLLHKSGLIRNVVLVGDGTKIQSDGALFDNVTIRGSWNVPEISTKLFAHLSGSNALRNVLALTNPKIHNRIVIEKGFYKVVVREGDANCLAVGSNTDLVINGTIQLEPNDLKGYNIIDVTGGNIRIRGKGTLIGDKHTHTGEGGEWGMGIRLHKAVNATVSGLTIKDCWGDCIYVGGNSRDVLIEDCVLDHGRRQGISITKANGVTIRNCTITNVGGTNPQYAIDVEPNRRDSVDNILIERVTVKDCEGGFLATRGKPKNGANTPWIGRVTIRNCQVASKSKGPVSVKRCEEVRIEKCSLYARKGRTAIFVAETGKAMVQSNTASIDGSIIEKAKNGAKKLMGKAMEPIHVKTTGQCIVKNNKIVER